MTPDAERRPGESGVVHRSEGGRINLDDTTPKFGTVDWAAAWRVHNPTGPFQPLIVAEAAWRAAVEAVG